MKVGDLEVAYDARGKGEPALLVHGTWGSRAWWEPVLDRMPPRVHAFTYDLRGRGETRGPADDVSIKALARDLGRLADALGLDVFSLAGHSLGSAVAMQFALDQPHRPRALALVSPVWVDGMPAALDLPAHQERLAADRAFTDAALRAITPAAPRDALWERIVDATRAQTLATGLATNATLREWAPGDALRSMSCPRTVIVGALDLLTPPAVAERAAQALGAKLIVMEGVGHGPMLEAPDAFADVLWKALRP
jgi:pimeloyl-ACP methyl ester carboxylesterase